jgi:hypothetical protein
MTTKNIAVYKILRLNTGEDIMGHCILDDEDDFVLISNPMKVVLRRMSESNQTLLMMAPWLPLELVEEDLAAINYEDIITMVQPKKTFIDYYNDTVENYQLIMEKRRDEDFSDYEVREEEQDQDSFDSAMDEILNSEDDKKNQTLH